MKIYFIFYVLALIIFVAFPGLAQKDTSLTFSEIMYSTTGTNSEFIELFNTSNHDTINLSSWVIKYSNTTRYEWFHLCDKESTSMEVLPHQYVIILEYDYDTAKGIYRSTIPPAALTVKIHNNYFADSGLSKATNRTIYLCNSSSGDTIDSYTCGLDTIKTGYSVEKINLTKDNSASNWSTSRYYRGTPGRTNSVTPKNIDAMIASFTHHPTVVFKDSIATLRIGLLNNGTLPLNSCVVELYKTSLKDSLIGQLTPGTISPGDTLFLEPVIQCKDTGTYNFKAKVIATNDEDNYNDTLSFSFNVFIPTRNYNDAVLNELMYAPIGDMPEWVEIYNRCRDTINLKKWKLCDPVKQTTITTANVYVAPDSYFIIARDSLPHKTYPADTRIMIASLPVMNNDGDYIALKDSFGLIIDSIAYTPHWGGSNGTSLERMYYDSQSNDSTNWGSSLNPRLCSPGFINSMTPKEYDIAISSFSPSAAYYSESDSISFIMKILNRGTKPCDMLNLRIYNDINRDSSGTQDELLFSEQRTVLLPGETDSLILRLSTFPAGKINFIATVSAGIDNDSSNNYRYTTASVLHGGNPRNKIVINEIMYAPPTGEPEWIELYNRSAEAVNLKKFHIADDADTSSIAKSDVLLQPGAYCVVSRDSSILKKYPCMGQLLVNSFPTLNNDGDKVLLLDSLYRVIDSLGYFPVWSSTAGTSLERITTDGSSTDSSNWISAKTRYKATPGYCNSVTPKTNDISISSLTVSPRYPATGDTVLPSAVIYNTGSATALNIRVTFSYANGNKILKPLTDTVVTNLAAKDSVCLTSSKYTSAINDSQVICVRASINADEDTSNDYRDITLKSGNRTGSIVINEIMFNPRAGNSEWIELYNTTKDSINLNGWRISDVLTTPTEDTIKTSACILPFGYFTISRDTLPVQGIGDLHYVICKYGTLNNAADGVVIKDQRGSVIDSVLYSSNWNTRAGKSLERISPTAASNDSLNWLFSYDAHGGTPGRANSVNSIQSATPGAVAINELMYEPGGDNAEFVELYNTTTDSILLNAWKLSTAGKNNYYMTDSIVTLPPKTYFVVCSDSIVLFKYPLLQNYIYKCVLQSGSLGLLNSNTSIVLRDAYKNVIDSVYYRKTWHNPNFTSTNNRSLERINPILSSNDARNWSSSASKNGATPGETNSIFIGSVSTSSQLNISPNPFSPDNDGHEDFTSITFQTPYPMTQVSIKIFDDKGRLMRELTNNETFGSNGTIIYDGRDKNGNPLRLGMYIVLFEAVNPQTGAKQVHKKVLVSARKL